MLELSSTRINVITYNVSFIVDRSSFFTKRPLFQIVFQKLLKFNKQFKVELHVALAPVLHWQGLQNPMRFISTKLLSWLRFYKEGNFQILSKQQFPGNLLLNSFVCGFMPVLCHGATSLLLGFDHNRHVIINRYANYMKYFPAGTAFKNIEHYLQVRSKVLSRHDNNPSLHRHFVVIAHSSQLIVAEVQR